jgi:formylglycine-generating enzyme
MQLQSTQIPRDRSSPRLVNFKTHGGEYVRQVTSIQAHRANRLPAQPSHNDMVWIPGGTALLHDDDHFPDNNPERLTHVDGFWIDRYPVTNEAFRLFVAATGYVTAAECAADVARHPGVQPHLHHAGSLVRVPPCRPIPAADLRDWWAYIRGADWRHPYGPHSDLDGLDHHPVVHVTCQDAKAFARWAGKRLPSELQWQYAARGGQDTSAGARRRRVREPSWNTLPVDESAANGFGLHDMIGNVWEWTLDGYVSSDAEALLDARGMPREARAGIGSIPYKVIKGGAHLCRDLGIESYCAGARLPQRMDISAFDVGFRCVVPAVHDDV